jgi:hypothetical protein
VRDRAGRANDDGSVEGKHRRACGGAEGGARHAGALPLTGRRATGDVADGLGIRFVQPSFLGP